MPDGCRGLSSVQGHTRWDAPSGDRAGRKPVATCPTAGSVWRPLGCVSAGGGNAWDGGRGPGRCQKISLFSQPGLWPTRAANYCPGAVHRDTAHGSDSQRREGSRPRHHDAAARKLSGTCTCVRPVPGSETHCLELRRQNHKHPTLSVVRGPSPARQSSARVSGAGSQGAAGARLSTEAQGCRPCWRGAAALRSLWLKG